MSPLPRHAIVLDIAGIKGYLWAMLSALIKTARPYQWQKNLVVFAALVFAHKYTDSKSITLAFLAFAAFCLASSAIYFLNDISDRDKDRNHPSKKHRPIASGKLSLPVAWLTSVILLAAAMLLAMTMNYPFFVYLAGYVLLNIAYNIGLKNIVIIDVMSISAGFVLRAAAGAAAIDVPISSWLLVCTTLLALFLGFAKRRHELVILGDGAVSHRQSLAHYSPYFLDQMISVVTASTVVAYAFYTLSPEIQQKFHSRNLILTIPFVLYGIFRYLYLVHQKDEGGNPARLMITDAPLLVCVALWVVTVIVIIQFEL